MSSGFHDGDNLFNPVEFRHISFLNNRFPIQYQPQLGGISTISNQRMIPNSFVKRPFSELERIQEQQRLLMRSVRPKTLLGSPISPMDFSCISAERPNISDISISYLPTKPRMTESQNYSEGMKIKLQELEKQLLDDNEEDFSKLTSTEWSDNLQSLIKSPFSPSSTSSSSSSSSIISSSMNIKQLLQDSISAISEGKIEMAAAVLARLKRVSNPGSGGDRLTSHIVTSLLLRINPSMSSFSTEIIREEHCTSMELLYETSPCFKNALMAANLAIIQATKENQNLHIVDFDIGQGTQYFCLIQALAERNFCKPTLRITIVNDPNHSKNSESVTVAVERLNKFANSMRIMLKLNSITRNVCELSSESIGYQRGEALVVNFGFFLYKLPDESVSTANPRDQLLRRVKSLDPVLVTLVEQDINTNTAPFVARFNESFAYYQTLLESLDSTLTREAPDRVKIEECLARKVAHAVACEGGDRIERCEVFGKWRARMGMAGFKPSRLGLEIVESVRSRFPSNSSFVVKEEAGGICLGWMGRILTVASSWR